MNEVRCVRLGALGGFLRAVGLLVVHVDLGAGHFPIAMPAGPALFVKVEIRGVARVAALAGPHLDAGARIARENRGGVLLVVGAVDEVGLVQAAGLLVHERFGRRSRNGAVSQTVRRLDRSGLFDKVRVHEEVFEIALRECLLDADAVVAGWGGKAVGAFDGIVPEACRTVPALRRPYAARMLADVSDVYVDRRAYLRANAFVGPQQRHISVGGPAGDDLDQARVAEVAEAADDVAFERVEIAERVGKKLVPEAGCVGEMLLAGAGEEGL